MFQHDYFLEKEFNPFARVDGPEHENRIKFRFSLNPLDPGGFKIRKLRYCKKIPVVEISQS